MAHPGVFRRFVRKLYRSLPCTAVQQWLFLVDQTRRHEQIFKGYETKAMRQKAMGKAAVVQQF
eukprot:scaffold5319_cov44-Attheya_sp.AAC.2